MIGKILHIAPISTSLLLSMVFLFSAVLVSCDYDSDEDGTCEHQPAGCVKTPYSTGPLTVSYTTNSENPTIKLIIYRGNIEYGNIYKILDPPVDNPYTETSAPIGDYSAKVDYHIGIYTITAVDGDSIDADSENYCEGPCYSVSGAYIDVTLDEEAFRDHLEGKDEECFIATATYGSPLAEEVNRLRRFREEVLRKSVLGRGFIALYNRFSPPIARTINRHEGLRIMSRFVLYPLIMTISYPIYALGIFFGCIIVGVFWSLLSSNRKILT